MPVLRVADGHFDDAEVYEGIVNDIRLHTEHPAGLMMHGLGRNEGRIQIVQIWFAREYAERFDEETLLPALRTAGVDLDSREVTWTDLDDLVTP